jgi:hypothetical protein
MFRYGFLCLFVRDVGTLGSGLSILTPDNFFPTLLWSSHFGIFIVKDFPPNNKKCEKNKAKSICAAP